MVEATERSADRAPLIDLDAEEEAGADPNRLSWLDWAWLVLHLAGASGDALALRALLRRRFKGALFFGGHTQFLGNWSLCLSIGTRGRCCPEPRAPYTAQRPRPAPAPFCTLPAHMPGASRQPETRLCLLCLCGGSAASHGLAVYSALAISPAPKVYNSRRHEHRDRTYRWQALVSGTLVIVSAVVMASQSLLLFVGEDQFQRAHLIPDLWLDFGVAGYVCAVCGAQELCSGRVGVMVLIR